MRGCKKNIGILDGHKGNSLGRNINTGSININNGFLRSSRSSQDLESQSRFNRDYDAPSAPSPGLVLFNSEEQADMIFNVGIEPSHTWRIPAHSFVVDGASPVFQAIVHSRQNSLGINYMMGDKKPEISVYCQPEIFHSILR